jgi:hypothetical protein
MKFEITALNQSTVWSLYRMRGRIQMDPEYQRLSGIWAPDNRQLLIDTILNRFDIPKLYLHKFAKPLLKGGRTYDYAIVDGKQRLETIWSFIDGRIALADDFKWFRDEAVKAGGITYAELGKQYPDIKADFDGYLLSVMLIETDDVDMIEEMFSRLNEAAPLTAPEKRNAYGGPIPSAVRKLASEEFFFKKLPFQNTRYRHFDLATKFLLAEHEGRVSDTKKKRLDEFVMSFARSPRMKMPPFLKSAQANLKRMNSVFIDSDPLLKQVGMIMLYFHLFRVAEIGEWSHEITRKKLVQFEAKRAANRALMEDGKKGVDLDLIEFDRYSQSPNDGGAIRYRLFTMIERVFQRKISKDDL